MNKKEASARDLCGSWAQACGPSSDGNMMWHSLTRDMHSQSNAHTQSLDNLCGGSVNTVLPRDHKQGGAAPGLIKRKTGSSDDC